METHSQPPFLPPTGPSVRISSFVMAGIRSSAFSRSKKTSKTRSTGASIIFVIVRFIAVCPPLRVRLSMAAAACLLHM